MANEGDIRAGGAYVEIGADDSSFVKTLAQTGEKLKSFGADLVGIGTKMVAIGAGMAVPIIAAINAAGDFDETLSKFETVFGDNKDAVRGWADEYRAAVGRSEKDVLDFLSKSQSILVPLGFDEKQATDLSKILTTLSVDLASFHNIAEDQEAFRALTSGILGSTEVLRERFGTSINETILKQRALENGMDPKNLTESQKVWLRLNEVIKTNGFALGDAQRTASSFNNQMKRLKSTVYDTAVTIGKQLLPVVTPLVEKAAALASVFADFIAQNPQVIRSFALMVAEIFGVGVALVTIGGLVMALGALLSPAGALAVAFVTFAALLDILGLADTGFGKLFNSIRIGGTGIGTWLASFLTIIDDLVGDMVTGFEWAGRGILLAITWPFRKGIEVLAWFNRKSIDLINSLIDKFNEFGKEVGIEIQHVQNDGFLDTLDSAVKLGAEAQSEAMDKLLAENEKRKRDNENYRRDLFKADPQDSLQSGVDWDKLKEAAIELPGKLLQTAGIGAQALGLDALFEGFSGKLQDKLNEIKANAASFKQDFDIGAAPGGGVTKKDNDVIGTFSGLAAAAFGGSGIAQQQLRTQQSMLETLRDIARNTEKGGARFT